MVRTLTFTLLLFLFPLVGLAQPSSENFGLRNYSLGGQSQSIDATSTNYGADLEAGGRYVYTSATTTEGDTGGGGGGGSSSGDDEEDAATTTDEVASSTPSDQSASSTASSSEPSDPEETEETDEQEPIPAEDPEPTGVGEESDPSSSAGDGSGGGGGDGNGQISTEGGGATLSPDPEGGQGTVDDEEAHDGNVVARTVRRVTEAVIPPQVVRSISSAVETTRRQLKQLEPALERVEPVSRPTEYTGVTWGLLSSMFATSRVPFALSNLWHILSHSWLYLLGYTTTRRRHRPWGTVYDSITKAPLDPALVELVDEQGASAADAITDLDGRYGFVIPEGTYEMRVKKTNYTFPSMREQGLHTSTLYKDLYFGGPFSVSGAVNRDIPMDPVKFDWNQFEKLRTKQTHFYHRFDHFLARLFNLLFYTGAVVAFLQFIVRTDLISGGLFIIYLLLVVYRYVHGGPMLYGTIEREGRPIPYAVVKVMRDGVVLQQKVADKYGRYAAIVSPGRYDVRVEEQVAEDAYAPVFETSVNAKKGIINDSFTVRKVSATASASPQ